MFGVYAFGVPYFADAITSGAVPPPILIVEGDIVTSNAYFRRVATGENGTFARERTSKAYFRRDVTTEDGER